jgi:hypothetical protein
VPLGRDGVEKLTTNWNGYFIRGIYTPPRGVGGQPEPQHVAVPSNVEENRLAESNLCRAADAQFLDPETKGAGVKFQDRCSSGWPLDSPVGFSKSFQYMFAFHGGQIL